MIACSARNQASKSLLRSPPTMSSRSIATLSFLLFFLLHFSSAAAGNDNLTAYQALASYDLPAGLLPQGALGYDLNVSTGAFSAYLNGSCSFSLEGSYQLDYKSTITGVITSGRLSELHGVSVKVLFFWVNIIEVRRLTDSLRFSVGIASADFAISNFYISPRCGCGLNCPDDDDSHDSIRFPLRRPGRHQDARLSDDEEKFIKIKIELEEFRAVFSRVHQRTKGYKQKVKDIVKGALFPEAGLNPGVGHAGGVGGLVVVRDINLFSYCESCLLPFSIKCHVGYVPSGGRVVGLSKLSRVADVFARRFQDPKRLASEVCAALHNSINPAGVAVSLQCWHMKFNHSCDTNFTHSTISDMRSWGTVLVSSRSGVFKEEKNSWWDDFASLLKLSGAVIEGGDANHSHVSSWCPSRSLEVPVSNGHCVRNSKNGKTSSTTTVSQASMVAAVASILHYLGEDTSRKELLGTPDRYVQWLLNFKSSNWGLDLNSLDVCKVSSCAVKDGNIDSKNEMQTELSIPFFSLCEHHLLPFHGVVHIGYLTKQEGIYIERSALQQMVHFFACKLQVQERLTRQIAEAVYSNLNDGVMVIVEAHHNCMISRGIEKVGSNTATIAALGQFSSDSNTKALFLQKIASDAASGV